VEISLNLKITRRPLLTISGIRSVLIPDVHVETYFFRLRLSLLNINLTLRSLTLYIYGAPILDVSRSHTTTQHSR